MNPTTQPSTPSGWPAQHCQPVPHHCVESDNPDDRCPQDCCPTCCRNDCFPPEPMINIRVSELASMLDLLSEVDEFLRCGNGVEHLLAAHYASHGDRYPYHSACNFIDAVSFTAADLPHLGRATTVLPLRDRTDTDDRTGARR
jgi:hypothetical protein